MATEVGYRAMENNVQGSPLRGQAGFPLTGAGRVWGSAVRKICFLFFVFCTLSPVPCTLPCVFAQQEQIPARISLDLKGIDIIELLRILSLKMGMNIAPSKNVAGRINIYLNNLTFQDALDVILISQDLACDRQENAINVMTAEEYEKFYG